MKRLFSRFLLTMVLGLIVFSTQAQQLDTLKEKEAIKTVIKNYEDAWNRHDFKGLAAQYRTDATWVNWFGSYSKDKKDIEAHYKTVHESYFKNTRFYTRSIEDITFVKPDVAIIHVRTGLTGDERYPGQTFEFRRLLVFTKSDGKWLILAGQNAKLDKNIQ